MFEQYAIGRNNNYHKFEKPWWQTFIMFIGMFAALIVYVIYESIVKCKARKTDIIINNDKTADNDQIHNPDTKDVETLRSKLKTVFILAIPACCDLLSTGISNVALLWIQASAWNMLRGAMVVFSAIFHALILKRKYYGYMWFGVAVVTIALVVVGASAACSTGIANEDASEGKVIIAILLMIGSQVIRAAQVVLEDYLLHDIHASPIYMVGIEGMWGCIITLAVAMPIVQFAASGSEEGNGIHEDTLDTLYMLVDQPILIGLSLVYIVVILFFNTTAMFVTNITNAVMRTIIESMRTLCIWIVQVILYYSLEGTDYGNHHPSIGESWSKWSFMQLSGFLLLFTGMLIYNSIWKLPFVYYEKLDEKKPEEEFKVSDTSNKPPLVIEKEL
ncbi:putative integral membrane protein [Tritrichomonas foetus]|uniref:Integral membrane protein n=1 Tax=Tritrichomonas foetus TaxID=1144522 RepID=A0A1J4K3S2_9EUKA|nr:putative integral membrane protein [Tritrichomonas foetus]|eukprot:OHT05480.1 putative integral membrane protein [Tritrichomonas foetus]